MPQLVSIDNWPPTQEQIADFRAWMLANGICPPAEGFEYLWMGPRIPLPAFSASTAGIKYPEDENES